MVIKVIQNFARTDCVHYQLKDIPGCCGRTHKAGVCTIEYRGLNSPKTCSTKMKWCGYEPEGRKAP